MTIYIKAGMNENLTAAFGAWAGFNLPQLPKMCFNDGGEFKGDWLQDRCGLVRAFNDNSSNGGNGGSGPEGWILPAGKGGTLLARPPVKVDFLGTLPGFQPDPDLSDKANERGRKLYEHQAEENEALLKKAVFILSQSATGRHLLEEMTKEGYRISFDDSMTGSRGAGGLCDPQNRQIVLKSSHDPEYIALVLGHEAVHALQHSRYNVFPSSSYRPEEGIALSFAIEADAYAQQTQIAFELAQGDPAGPKNQLTLKGPLHQMQKRFPNIVKAAEKTLGEPGALVNGALAATAFQGFYDNPYLRTFYEDGHMEWVRAYAPRLMSGPTFRRHFEEDAALSTVATRLMHRGRPYLATHAPSLDLAHARYSGVTAVTERKLKAFYKQFLPARPTPVFKRYGVHMKNAVAWVLGMVSESGAAVIMEPSLKKKPNPAPPKNPSAGGLRRRFGGR